MTRTNRFTLIATILLGILLFTIIRFAYDLNVAWHGGKLEPPPASVESQASSLPRITKAADLRDFLARQEETDPASLLEGYADWSDARGFTGENRLFGVAENAPSATFIAGDEAELRARSAAGDAAASQALAAGMLFDDLFVTIELLHTAAEQGSTFALLRIGALFEALDAAGTAEIAADPAQRQKVAGLAGQGVGNSLRLTALGYVIAAIRDAGAPIVDRALLEWLARLNADTTSDERTAVCAWSEHTLLDIAGARIRRGRPAVATTAPPVFFAVPDFTDRLPCTDTAFPIENLLDLDHCTITPVRNAANEVKPHTIDKSRARPGRVNRYESPD